MSEEINGENTMMIISSFPINAVQLHNVPQIDLSSKKSNKEIKNYECRICLQQKDEEQSELISPCDCTGSVQYVHVSCFRVWIYKKYQDPQIREQILSNIGLKCQICNERYQFSYEISKVCVTPKLFCRRMKGNKFFAVGNISFIIVDIILLSIVCSYAASDRQKPEFDITQPRYFLTYIAMLFAIASFFYGIYQFITFFLMTQKFILFPENKAKKLIISPQKFSSLETQTYQQPQENYAKSRAVHPETLANNI